MQFRRLSFAVLLVVGIVALSPQVSAQSVASVAAGYYHSTFITPDGTLWATGNNASGQLGDGPLTSGIRFTAVPVATNVASVSAGANHTMFVKKDGTLWGMGDNSSGQLGVGGGVTTTDIPMLVTGGVLSVSAGGNHTLFVKQDGTLWGMGDNGEGQLGDNSLQSRFAPVSVAGGVASVSTGDMHTIFVKHDGTMWLMGRNPLNIYDSSLYPVGGYRLLVPMKVQLDGIVGNDVASVSAGGLFSMFIKTDGTLWAMGFHDFGSSANSYTSAGLLPEMIATSVASVSASGAHVMFVKSNSELWGIGANEFGQLGIGGTEPQSSPVKVTTGVASVSAGDAHTVFVKTDGTFWGMGHGGFGQLGQPFDVAWISDPLFFNPVQIFLTVPALPVALGGSLIAAGDGHSMFVRPDGMLWAVGWNEKGQLGDCTTTDRSTAVQISGIVESVAAGSGYTMFVKTDGTLWAVGRNEYGQLGNGTRNDAPVPTKVASDVRSVAVGGGRTMFVKTDDTLWAMGRDIGNQLPPDQYVSDHLLPYQIASGVASVSVGEGHALFVKLDETLWAMGLNTSGQLGDDTGVNQSAPVQVTTGVASVSAGGRHTTFVKRDKTLWVMGDNSAGQLGDGGTTNRYKPVKVLDDVRASAAGGSHSLFVKLDNTLWAMGANGSGQLGDGSITDRKTPVPVASAVIAVSAGNSHTLFMTFDSKVWAMGDNFHGELGIGNSNLEARSPIEVIIPPNIHPVAAFSKISAGASQSMFVKVDGTLWGMGANDNSQLGTLPGAARSTPVKIAGGVLSVGAGLKHTMFLKTDGTLWGTGDNFYGQVGDAFLSVSAPVQVATEVAALAVGDNHTMFVKTDGTLWGMGDNFYGQLGDGTTTAHSSPVKVADRVVSVAAFASHTLFVRTDGTLWGMGDKIFGFLGNSSHDNFPVQVASSVMSVATGAEHTLFVKKDDTLWGVGDSIHGQLGNIIAGAFSAEQLDSSVASVAAGGDHTMFIKKDGTLWATGRDLYGQLGDGMTSDRYSPVPVANYVASVAASTSHTLFMMTDGTVWAMGWNSSGQLGDGTVVDRHTPVPADRYPQVITFYRDPLPDVLPGTAPFEIDVTASSGLPVSLEIVSGPATIDGHMVTLTGVGTVVVRASQAGLASIGAMLGYNAAPDVERSFKVDPNAATGVTGNGFTANWASVVGAVRYQLDVSLSNLFGSFVSGFQGLDLGNVVNRIIPGLSPGTTYYYRVQAYDANGVMVGSPRIVSVITAPAPTAAPTANAATAITGAGFTANWSSVSGATGYRLDVSASNTFGSFVSGFQDLNVGNALTRTVTGLSGGTTYYYRVRSYKNGSASGNSGTISVATTAGPPASPTVSLPTGVTSGGFTANWVVVGGATDYRLDVSASSAFDSFIGSYQDFDAGNVSSLGVSGLSGGSTYYYRVRAKNASGTSGSSSVATAVTLAGPPASPIASAATGVTSAGFTANWTGGSGATGYRLDVSTSNTFGSYISGYQNLDVGNVLSKGVTGLSVSTVYYYRVRAYNGGGTSANSNTITNATGALPYYFTTVAGTVGITGGTGSAASALTGVAVDSAGNVFVTETYKRTIRKVAANGVVTTLAGTAGSVGSTDGTGSNARFSWPTGIAVDNAGNVFVADTFNHTIRKITSAGVVTTLAGVAGSSGSTDATGSNARFSYPWGLAVDGVGNLFVADSANNSIRKITSAGVVTTLAGLAGGSGSTDATGSNARFSSPYGVAVDGSGNVYVADSGNHTIRKITSGGVVTTLAGAAGSNGSADGTGTGARFYSPDGVAVDGSGNVYVADAGNCTIRKITAGGVVTTLGGKARKAGLVDGMSNEARFSSPSGVAVDGNGYLFVADQHAMVRKGTPPSLAVLPVFGGSGIPVSAFGSAIPAGTGQNLTASLVAGSGPMTFQWRLNGVDIPGANKIFYYAGNWQPADAGAYTVVATNATGSVTSGTYTQYVTPEGGWQWRNPQLSGNALTSATFLNGHFLIGGVRGTLLESTDGFNWNTRTVPTANNLYGFQYFNGLYVALGSLGSIFTSPDAVVWTPRNSGIPNQNNPNLLAMASSGSRLVAVGYNGIISTSIDGINWTAGSIGTDDDLNNIIFANGQFYAISGEKNQVYSSVDGSTWTLISTAAYQLASVAFGAGRFVATASYGFGDIYTSTNGSDWTGQNSGTNNPLYGVNFINGMFIATGASGTILTSPDGLQWTTRSPGGNLAALQTAAFGNGVYVIPNQSGPAGPTFLTSTDGVTWSGTVSGVGPAGTVLLGVAANANSVVAVGTGGTILQSSDGAQWNQRTSTTTNPLNDVNTGAGLFVAVGSSGTVVTSADGVTWSAQSNPSLSAVALGGVRYDNGLWVVVGVNSQIFTSTSGSGWILRYSGGAVSLNKSDYGGGVYVAVGDSGTIVTSANGTNWTPRTSGTSNRLADITYGGGLHVVVGAGVVLTSTDGVTWTNRTFTPDILNSVIYAGGQFIATGPGSTYYVSPNGINWSGRFTGTSDTLSDMVLFNNQVFGVSYNSDILSAGIPVVSASDGVAGMAGSSVTLSAAVSASAVPVTYQWQRNGVNLSGATSTTLLLNNLQTSQAGSYTLIATNAFGSATGNATNLTVTAIPGFTTQPSSQAVSLGSVITFAAMANGTPMYQWKKNNVSIHGATGASLTLTNVQLSSAGTYTVVATNPAGSTTSSAAMLTVVVPVAPLIVNQPAGQIVIVGSPVTLTASASGSPTPTYQWRKNNVNISGATGSSFIIPSAVAGDSGSYTVVASNSVSSVTSNVATLTVYSGGTIPAGFDVSAYLSRYPDVAAMYGSDLYGAWLHYRNVGIYQGEIYDELFRVEEYLALYPELFAIFGSDLGAALEHWLSTGRLEGKLGRIPLEFSAQGYFSRNPDVATAVGGNTILAWGHYWLYGIYEGRAYDDELRVFEYLAINADLTTAFVNDWRTAALHWMRYGRTEGRLGRLPLIFSATEYLNRNPDVATTWGTNPTTDFLHFWLFGIDEGRTFDNFFRVDDYLALNPDLLAIFGTDRRGAFKHWVRYGQAEGRPGRNP